MVCGPVAATRCCGSFNGILFMPSDYAKRGVCSYYSKTVNVVTYYALVLASFTGISTLIGSTDTLAVEENLKEGLGGSPDLTKEIMSCLSCSDNAKLIRRFHFHFYVPAINVQMFHVRDEDDGKLYLIEIYNKNSRLTQIYMVVAMAIFSFVGGRRCK